jgi:UPF0716 family protein affecting phage T7 exclusion
MPIFFLWTIVEILIFAAFADNFGFLRTLLAYFLPTILGLLLLSRLRTKGFAKVQASLNQGQEPSREILLTAARAFGAVLLLPPSFFSRVFGLALLTPGITHLLVLILKVTLLKRIVNFGSGFVRTGAGSFSFYSAAPRSYPYEREVKPIEVKLLPSDDINDRKSGEEIT